MEFDELIKQRGKCCISGKPLNDCEFINLIETSYAIKWEFPKGGNILTGVDGLALSVVHDSCISNDTGKIIGEIQFCIEIKDDEIIYHPVSELQKHPSAIKNEN